MKKGLILLAGVAVALASCSDEALLNNDAISNGKKAIGFGADITKATRNSYEKGNFFVSDVIVVNGFDNSTTGDSTSNQIFKDKDVTLTSSGWTYTPAKYWEYGVKYDFYAAFPKGTVVFDPKIDKRVYKVTGFQVTNVDTAKVGTTGTTVTSEQLKANKKANDLMIADRILGATPFQDVNFLFRHILANVNFTVEKPSVLATKGIDSVAIDNFTVKNIFGKGDFNQTKWTNNSATATVDATAQGEGDRHNNVSNLDSTFNVGGWTIMNYKDTKAEFPERKGVEVKTTATYLYKDYMVIPQKLFTKNLVAEADPTLEITYTVGYSDKTKQTFTRSLRLSSVLATGVTNPQGDPITGEQVANTNVKSGDPINTWFPNYKYTYAITIDPSKSTVYWEADANGDMVMENGVQTATRNADGTPIDTEEAAVAAETDGGARFNPDEPNVIQIWEDKNSDGKVQEDEWVDYPIVWYDVDNDGKLEAIWDKNKDGKPDNIDGNKTQGKGVGADSTYDGADDPTYGYDAILVNTKDETHPWQQIEKDPDTGIIGPKKETQDGAITFKATVADWAVDYKVGYEITK